MASEVDGRTRVIIESISPAVDGGAFPAKRVAGDRVVVEADIFSDGHDVVAAVVLHRHESEERPREAPMRPLANDRWRGELTVETLGFHHFTVEAWVDHFLTWHRDLRKRVSGGVGDEELEVQLEIGAGYIRAAAARAPARDRRKLEVFAATLAGTEPLADRIEEVWSDDLQALMWRNGERRFAVRHEPELRIEVDPPRAAFGSWYELFPRSAAGEPGRHGTFADVEAQLPRIASMGFDVLYLPPIHPIGTTFRKGKNNVVAAAPDDAGSPWAIGSAEGGHKAVHPRLGTPQDFERLVARGEQLGISIALDIAFQASPDHPWVKEHPEWFRKRPDGTIQYAENPPKKYQDIYPIDFETEAWRELWAELRSVFAFWAGRGVRVFRVDNPHTKSLRFWEWCIRDLKREWPDLIFLSEAFTRPKIMYRLAKGGFTQSYTYFAWRHTSFELREYFEQITRPPVSDFFRPNVWPNTPDILTEFLQTSGRAGFTMRLVLAATLSANYGIYGPAYERMIAAPREPGSEEYLDSEKYEIRHWPRTDDDLSPLVGLLNRIRRENRALQQNETLWFHGSSNEQVLCYSKSAGDNVIVTVVNLDPYNTHGAWLDLDLGRLQLEAERSYQVHDLLTGARYTWHGSRTFVQVDPSVVPAHVFRIRRKVRTERDFEYYL